MKNLSFTFIALLLISSFALANTPPCPQMREAATALAKVNGGTFVSSSRRTFEVPILSKRGLEYESQFDVFYSPGDELPNIKIGAIQAKALIKLDKDYCKVTELLFTE